MSRATDLVNVTIANGESLSGAITLGYTKGAGNSAYPETYRVFGIDMPSSWTTANLTFQGSVDGTTWKNIYTSDGTELTVTAAASRLIVLEPYILSAVTMIKVRSGTSGSAVNQGGERVIGLVVRQV